jgi:Putative polyhydroxyalkanoic acid system protein (PHA_gran_rgn)
MSKPLIVSIPHHLGTEEATRRIKSGLAQVRSSFGTHLASVEETWSAERCEFRVGLLGQTARGTIEVAADNVRLEVVLPWMLAMLAEKAQRLIRKEGQLMLEKK